jgi:exodeoxyribonuclease VII large subunit
MARLKTISTRNHERKILSVSELNAQAKGVLEQHLFQVWVEAEISNLTLARSGHWYFSLKDSKAQVSCAMFRGSNMRSNVKPADGIKVRVRGKVSLYEPRGSFQLIVDHMEVAGVGDLLRQFEELKQKLSAEGLFAPEHKRPISHFNHRIGVITSATGAAIHDVLSTIERRFPLQEVILYPSLVQGAQAAENLRRQLAVANERNEVDVLLVVRGGGAIEDLWSFNDEQLARDIFHSEIPVVSGV